MHPHLHIASAITLSLDSSDGLVVMNVGNVGYVSSASKLSNAYLVVMLYRLTLLQVQHHQQGQLRTAVIYRRFARNVGKEIMHRVKEGSWDT